jgi:2'-hydroxyisoflavone reductase
VGPGDPTERFTYWVRRMMRGGVVLAPGPEELEVQYLDARDLAVWTVSMAAGGVVGVYNAAGPRGPMTMRGLLEGIRENAGGGATLRWAAAKFLLDGGVAPWSDMPLWLPASEGSITADNSRAVAAGLAFRPLGETVADIVRWARQQPPPGEGPPGLPPAREADLIAKLRGD